eukprot:522123_1
MSRSITKVENDYINEDYPTSAKILDLNRCSLQFESINNMMKFIKIFTRKISNKNARCITHIIRCKNGWSAYNFEHPQYTDIKLNVLIQSPTDENKHIICEIQFLLLFMSAFKKKAHKLYGIERKFEMVYNFGKLTNEMNKFEDSGNGINDTIKGLAQKDDIKYFKLLWKLSKPNYKTLVDVLDEDGSRNIWDTALMNILMNKTGKIYSYLQEQYKDLYFGT